MEGMNKTRSSEGRGCQALRAQTASSKAFFWFFMSCANEKKEDGVQGRRVGRKQ